MRFETSPWCLLNILLRLFGIMAAVVAFGFGLTASLQLGGAGLPTPEIGVAGNLLIAALGLVLSVAFLTRPPYRPDLDLKKPKNSTLKLGWWTGTPKKTHV